MEVKILILLFVLFIGICESAKILMIMPMYTKSHNTIFEASAQVLAERGHKITFVTPYLLSKEHPNIEHYHIGDFSKMEENEEIAVFEGPEMTPFDVFYRLSDFFTVTCESVYQDERIQTLIKYLTDNKDAKVFDIAFVEMVVSECVIPLGSLVANYTVFLSVLNIPFWTANEMRIPISLATVPMVAVTDFGMPKNFYERLMNTYNSISIYFVWKFYILPIMQSTADKYLPGWAPSVLEAQKEVSFIFVNSDPVSAIPRSTVPFVAQIGGIHLKPLKPLPKELEEFMQSSGDEGVILFSFGSFVNTRQLPEHIKDAFLVCFRNLKQKILWKFHEPIEGAPKNLKTMRWIPQTDILAHPKLRLFITHGGLLSAQELIYYGVPMISLPVDFDQPQNADIVGDLGLGEVMSVRTVTTESFCNMLKKVLNDKRYAEKAQEASSIVKDRQNSPAENLIYWTEYILRHNGAHHLKNQAAKELHFLQYHLMDVWALILSVIAIGIAVCFFGLKFLIRLIFHKQKDSIKKKKTA